nr:uncharacterized protein LOC106846066 [Equus asinus]
MVAGASPLPPLSPMKIFDPRGLAARSFPGLELQRHGAVMSQGGQMPATGPGPQRGLPPAARDRRLLEMGGLPPEAAERRASAGKRTPWAPRRRDGPSEGLLVLGQAYEGRLSIPKCSGGKGYLQIKVKFKEGKGVK